jgi:hypothetical protein
LPPPGLELRPLGRPARSQSLYRLRYPSSISTTTNDDEEEEEEDDDNNNNNNNNIKGPYERSAMSVAYTGKIDTTSYYSNLIADPHNLQYILIESAVYSTSDNIHRMAGRLVNWVGDTRERLRPDLRFCSDIYLEGLSKMKYLRRITGL